MKELVLATAFCVLRGKKIGRCWEVMVGFENGVFQVECLAMIADPMGTLSKLLKCDSFLRPVFQLEVGRKKTIVCESCGELFLLVQCTTCIGLVESSGFKK